MFNHLRKYNAETALDLEARRQVLKALAKIMWHWKLHSASPRLSFHVCKMGLSTCSLLYTSELPCWQIGETTYGKVLKQYPLYKRTVGFLININQRVTYIDGKIKPDNLDAQLQELISKLWEALLHVEQIDYVIFLY